MKIRLSLKLALFAFLSALACVVANSVIGLVEIGFVADVLWFLSYICIIIWVCKYIVKVKRLGKNLVVTFFTFSIALYTGVYSSLTEESWFAVVGELLFYVAAIACLANVLILIGRWIFGNPDKKVEESNENKSFTAEVSDVWNCECGTVNTGKFCSECGHRKEETPVITEPKNEV